MTSRTDPDDGAHRPAAARVAAIVRSGLVAVLLHPLASGVTIACLATILAPLLAGLGIARGLADEAATSVADGADVHVAGERFGRPAPVPLDRMDAIRAIPGVSSVEPRIVGAVSLGDASEPVVVVGLPPARLPSLADCVEGRPCAPAGVIEMVVGSELARRLALRVGARLPPFYRNADGERVAEVVGILREDLPPWQAHAVIVPFDAAAQIFEERGTATSFLVACTPGYARDVAAAIRRLDAGRADVSAAPPTRLTVVTRDDLLGALARRTAASGGTLTLLWGLAFGVGVPLVLATTGLGLAERRREVGLLRALGWRTDEVVLRSLVEGTALAVAGASCGLAGAWVWVRVLGGAGIARAFLPDADVVPGFEVPFRLVPEAAAVAFAASVAVACVGGAGSSWRAASASPAEAMR